MESKEILKGNKLIADFMGVKIGVDLYSWRPGVTDPIQEKHLAYHDSWGWIMPVVEKINAGGKYDVIISRTTCHINDADGILFETSHETSKKGSLILSVWEPIVAFIKYYNEQKLIDHGK